MNKKINPLKILFKVYEYHKDVEGQISTKWNICQNIFRCHSNFITLQPKTLGF
jgi:hypothetical protein